MSTMRTPSSGRRGVARLGLAGMREDLDAGRQSDRPAAGLSSSGGQSAAGSVAPHFLEPLEKPHELLDDFFGRAAGGIDGDHRGYARGREHRNVVAAAGAQ